MDLCLTYLQNNETLSRRSEMPTHEKYFESCETDQCHWGTFLSKQCRKNTSIRIIFFPPKQDQLAARQT